MPVHVVRADPRARSQAGQVALQRGPLIYCLEEIDNGANLSAVRINPEADSWMVEWREDMVNGVAALVGTGDRSQPGSEDRLYAYQDWPRTQVTLTAVPYYAWGNRGVGEMRVWMMGLG
jgi:hypothetical protein